MANAHEQTARRLAGACDNDIDAFLETESAWGMCRKDHLCENCERATKIAAVLEDAAKAERERWEPLFQAAWSMETGIKEGASVDPRTLFDALDALRASPECDADEQQKPMTGHRDSWAPCDGCKTTARWCFNCDRRCCECTPCPCCKAKGT